MEINITTLKFEEVKKVHNQGKDLGKLLQAGCCTTGSGGCEETASPVKKKK
ncbi:hypothetical protein ACOQFO_01215 [Ureibacillus sp. MALMAid1270]|uniref:hypothetical protein n=1 Tax=Ureibacillus sp. MALMAid1270 TaxID=3411629 RepID=UPI003BA665E7